ncbi:MAG: hypothetical protein HY788_06970 [Deltaproteobacteria bacterium]|nr:hypothetical protein [Deltaproteobacteria bacterium]
MLHLSQEEAYAYVFAAAAVSEARGLPLADRLRIIDSFPNPTRVADEDPLPAPASAAETCGVRLSESFLRQVRRNAGLYREKAKRWLDGGLRVLKNRDSGERDGPRIFFVFGSEPKKDARRVAVLNSRKPGRITPDERWPKVTGHLAGKACEEGFDLVTSYGNVPYDLVSHVGNKLGAHVWVVCPDGSPFRLSEGSRLGSEFPGRAELFHSGRTTFVSPLPPCSRRLHREAAALRDRCVGNLAHEIWVAEIRGGGNMEAVGRRALERGKPVRVYAPGRFGASTGGNRNLLETACGGNVGRIDTHSHPGLVPKGEGQGWKANVNSTGTTCAGLTAKTPASRLDEPILVHYTRRCNGAWPGQTHRDYLEGVLGGAEDFEHTAFQALRRILREGRIRAGHRLIRGALDTVSFTECEPDEIRRLIRWQSALVRWSFEPYGIVFPKALLEEMGAVPVLYGDAQTYEALDEVQKFRFQHLDPNRTDWSQEKEWRCRGDLMLSAVPGDRLRVIAPSDEEAAEIWREYGVERWAEEK